MDARRKSQVPDDEAERRGKLAASEPGQYVFNDFEDFVDTMRTLCARSGLSDKALAEASSGLVKSASTFHNLTDGHFDRRSGDYRRTKNPTLKTTAGLGTAINYAIAFVPKGRKP